MKMTSQRKSSKIPKMSKASLGKKPRQWIRLVFRSKFLKSRPPQVLNLQQPVELPIHRKDPVQNDELLDQDIAAQNERCYCPSRSRTSPNPAFNLYYGPSCIGCGRCQKCASWLLSGSHPRCRECKIKSPLLSLPIEIQQKICSHLDISSTWLLRVTCRHLYRNISAPTRPMSESEAHTFYRLIRELIPAQLKYCKQCVRYHPWNPSDYYTCEPANATATQRFCLRDLDRTGRPPPAQGIFIGTKHYVCRYCHNVRPNRKCKTCFKCKSCAGVKYCQVGTECMVCDAGKMRCTECHNASHRKRCQRCKKCETCTGSLFQFGNTLCADCGGNPRRPATKRWRVTRGKGYTLYLRESSSNSPMHNNRSIRTR